MLYSRRPALSYTYQDYIDTSTRLHGDEAYVAMWQNWAIGFSTLTGAIVTAMCIWGVVASMMTYLCQVTLMHHVDYQATTVQH